MPDERVTLREAAIRLGVSEGAIRKRVARGTIRSEMGDDGLRYVWAGPLDGGADEGTDASSALVDELRDRVRYLEGQLDIRAEELREHRRIIAGLVQRVPELEAPQEPRGAPESVGEEPEMAEPRSATGGAQEGTERVSWWRRLFGE